MGGLTQASVGERLDLPADATAWLEAVADLPSAGDLTLPDDDVADEELRWLHVAALDRAEALSARPDPVGHPELWWVLDRAYRQLIATMGDTDVLHWPILPPAMGAVGRNAYVWLFLAALPAVRDYHAKRRIPDEVSRASLADLGQQMGVHRRIFGDGGLHTARWLTLAFRGAIYSLGRLQFNRLTIGFDTPSVPDGTTPPTTGESAIGVHIPETGPMDPNACDDSIAHARAFFPAHFPEEPVRFATCGSWLLDDQLAAYLPESSNIVHFQRRFQLVPKESATGDWTNGDRAVVEFVFRRIHHGEDYPGDLIAALPRETTLQRAIINQLEAGRHWEVRTGWFPL